MMLLSQSISMNVPSNFVLSAVAVENVGEDEYDVFGREGHA
jgi:hypothetical protein